MDYKQILNEIKPSKEESREILKTSDKLISYLNEVCKDEGITAHASLVGSVAKKTYLSGKSDIDVFISFPLDMDIVQLKKTGLYCIHCSVCQFFCVAAAGRLRVCDCDEHFCI